jgi:glycosyltransferase involved in cell wall biosynthesis
MGKLNYIHVVTSIDVNSSGIAYFVVNHARYMEQYSDNKIFCVNGLYPDNQSSSNKMINLFTFLKILFKPSNNLVIHFHGFWSIKYIFLLTICKLLNVKYVISPHGSLEYEALQISAKKKKLMLNLFLKKFIKNSLYLVAYSYKEKLSLTAFIETSKIIRTAIGIDSPNNFKIDSSFLEKAVILDNKKIILCITRIHKAKGLDLLLKAWASLPQLFIDWRIIIAGPDDGYLSELIKIRLELNLQDTVFILKKVNNVEKFSLYSVASIFILPSLSENFGIVIAEAMLCKIPVITTVYTPWVYTSESTGCYCIRPDSVSIRNALCEVVNSSPINLIERTKLGYKYISENHSWYKLTFKYHQFSKNFLLQD